MKNIEELLSTHPFFEGLPEADLQVIAGCASNMHFDAGQYLFKEGDPANRFFAIREGSVAIEIFVPERGAVPVQTVGEGEIVGWSWLFPPYVWRFDARAVTGVRTTSFDGACLRKKAESDPRLGYELMKRLARIMSLRLDATRHQLLDIYGRK
jgi:CRP/FNR family transcriptional regulator, cyclic AMP receptor protein